LYQQAHSYPYLFTYWGSFERAMKGDLNAEKSFDSPSVYIVQYQLIFYSIVFLLIFLIQLSDL